MDASVLIVGVGGLGCPAAAYLAAAGMGTLGLMDGDTVELSNLHRQILHNSTTLETSKVESALLYLHKSELLARALQCHLGLTSLKAESEDTICSLSPEAICGNCPGYISQLRHYNRLHRQSCFPLSHLGRGRSSGEATGVCLGTWYRRAADGAQ